jgi:mono/diheme cytochrome c family protein
MINSSISFIYTMINQLGYRHPLHPTQVHFPVGLIFGGELVYGEKTAPVAEKSELKNYQIGREIYAANCGGCHANGGNVIRPELPVKHSPKTDDFNTFLAWIRNPKAPMPAYPSQVLSDQQAENIYQYIIHVVNKS